MELWHIPLILLIGLFAGIVNTLAGGGSLLTLPLLITVLGLPSSLANGTNRVAIFIQCVTATSGFRQQGISRIRIGLLLSIPAVIGSVIGSQLAITIPEETFNKLLAIIMLVMVFFIVWQPKTCVNPAAFDETWRKWAAMLAFFGIGLYGGLIQAGTGFFITAALTLLCGFDLVLTAGVKVFIIAIYLAFSIVIFAWNQQIDWTIGLVLACGNGLGGWLGSKIAVKKGEKFIRVVLFISVFAMALKLLGVFSLF